MKQFIIIDWASNVLQHNGKFNFSSYGSNKGSPMIFKTFDDAWEWVYQNVNDESCYDDLFVERL